MRKASSGAIICALAWMLSLGVAAADESDDCLLASLDTQLDQVVEVCTKAIASGEFGGGLLAKLYAHRAEGFYRARRLENALTDIDSALALAPDTPVYLVRRANIHALTGNHALALRDAGQAIFLDPKTPNAHLALSVVLSRQGQDQRKVRTLLDEELRLNPENAVARRNLATNLFEMGDIEGAMREIGRVLDSDPAAVGKQFFWRPDGTQYDLYASAMSERAGMYAQLKKYDEALADMNWLVEHWPNEAKFLADRGHVLFLQADNAKALADFDAAIRLQPTNELARYQRAFIYMRTNRDKEALGDLNELVERGASRSQALVTRANLLKKLGDREAALSDLEQAFGLDTGVVAFYQQLLQSVGYYDGEVDGTYSESMRNGMKACLIDPECRA